MWAWTLESWLPGQNRTPWENPLKPSHSRGWRSLETENVRLALQTVPVMPNMAMPCLSWGWTISVTKIVTSLSVYESGEKVRPYDLMKMEKQNPRYHEVQDYGTLVTPCFHKCGESSGVSCAHRPMHIEGFYGGFRGFKKSNTTFNKALTGSPCAFKNDTWSVHFLSQVASFKEHSHINPISSVLRWKLGSRGKTATSLFYVHLLCPN